MAQLAKIIPHKRGVISTHGHKLQMLAGNIDADGIPLILIHGITSSPVYAMMTLRPPSLSENPWYALSLPGHVESTFPDNFQSSDLTPEYIGDMMADAVNQITKGKPAIIIGHSTGATTALLIASRAPELAHQVVSASGFVIGKWGSSLGLTQFLAGLGAIGKPFFNMAFLPNQFPVIDSLNANFHLNLWMKDSENYKKDPYNQDIAHITISENKKTQPSQMWHWFQQMPKTDITTLLKDIKAPVLAIAGDQDPVVPPEHARIIARETEGTLQLLNGVGHLPMQEQREEYNRFVDQWFDGKA